MPFFDIMYAMEARTLAEFANREGRDIPPSLRDARPAKRARHRVSTGLKAMGHLLGLAFAPVA